jgi:hypothetical protein
MTSRSFYGILRIDQYDDPDSQEYLAPIVKMKQTTDGTESFSTLSSAYRTQTRYNSLMHGTTLHGRQIAQPHLIQVGIDPETNEPVYDDAGILTSFQDDLTLLGVGTGWESVLLGGLRHSWDPTKDPLTYYHRTGPVGDLFRTAIQRTWSREQRLPEVGMVGLGTGSVACYASSGMNLTFYEIDRSVIDLVEKPTRVMNPAEVKAGKPANLGPFTFIEDARKRGAKIDFILGDARLTLERNQKARYDLLLIDAFSSDSIPIHLLTKESVRLYEQRLSDKGLLALHISNRYIQLEPVVAAIARDLGLVVRHFSDSGEQFPGKTSSTWVVLARSEDDLGAPFVPLKNQPVEEMLAGTWRATPNFLSDGKSSRQAFTLATIDGNQVICDLDGSYAPWSLTLRSGAQYLQFELARGAKEYHGILEIERPGEWNLCFTPKTEPIPKNFDSTSPGTISLNLKKKKSDVSQWTQLEILEQVEAWTDDHADVLRVIRLKELQAIRKMLGLPTPITE